jgi:hypothetical protein
MTNSIKLRRATAADYAFALDLYLRTMKPYTEALMAWDEQKQIASFAEQWNVADVQVICADGRDVGWLQARDLSVSKQELEPRCLGACWTVGSSPESHSHSQSLRTILPGASMSALGSRWSAKQE